MLSPAFHRFPVALALFGVVSLPIAGRVVARAGTPESTQRVVLLSPRQPDDRTREALVRVEGELVAAGFFPVLRPYEAAADPRGAVEHAVREASALAALAVVYRSPETPGAPAVELWVSEHVAGRTTVQRLTLVKEKEGRGSVMLAVYAVDLLKVALSDYWPASPGTPKVAVAPVATAVPVNVWRRLGVGVGGMGFAPAEGEPGGVLPSLRLTAVTRDGRWLGGLSLSGLGTAGRVAAETGSARLAHGFATAYLGWATWGMGRLSPLVLVALGVDRLRIEGEGIFPDSGRSGAVWSLFGEAAVGGRLRLGGHLDLVVAAGAMRAASRTSIRIDGVQAALTGGPSVVLDAWIEGRL